MMKIFLELIIAGNLLMTWVGAGSTLFVSWTSHYGIERNSLHDGQESLYEIHETSIAPLDSSSAQPVVANNSSGSTKGTTGGTGNVASKNHVQTGVGGKSTGQNECNPKGDFECPELPVVYQPEFPPLGQYSIPGVCASIHGDSDPSVTLQDHEALSSAVGRLSAISKGAGGIIRIPWNVDTIQCDSYAMPRKIKMPVTIKGVPGPEGQQPRFYCRSVSNGGTVPGSHRPWLILDVYGGRPRERQVLVENVHIDGYGGFVRLNNAGSFTIRNSYLHHATGDGFKLTGIPEGEGPGYGARLQFCGNEISHSGQGNIKHCFYIASNKSYGYGDQNIYVTLVDNLIHSCRRSSGFKSVARNNTIINNRFYNTLGDDPSTPKYESDPLYERQYSTFLVDVAACGENQIIKGNYFYSFRPEGEESDNSNWGYPVGIRNRKQAYGCDRPHCYRKGGVPATDTECWDPEWWAGLGKKRTLKLKIEDNTFRASGFKAGETPAIIDFGTYPNMRSGQFGVSCLLTPPPGWYERQRTYVENNIYYNYPAGDAKYLSSPPKHNEDKCGYSKPELDLRDYDLFEIGAREAVVNE
jgi:hypothetical protein